MSFVFVQVPTSQQGALMQPAADWGSLCCVSALADFMLLQCTEGFHKHQTPDALPQTCFPLGFLHSGDPSPKPLPSIPLFALLDMPQPLLF